MSYNYENEKKHIDPVIYDRVKNTVFYATKEIFTFDDFGADLKVFGTFQLLAIIDKLEEEGYIKLVKNDGMRQDWEYKIITAEESDIWQNMLSETY